MILVPIAMILTLMIGFLHVYNGARDGRHLRTLTGFVITFLGTPIIGVGALSWL